MANKMNMQLFIFIIISLLYMVNSTIINENVDRSIDLTSQLVKETYKIIASESNDKTFNEYVFVVPKNEREKLAYITAKEATNKPIRIVEEIKNDLILFKLRFDKSGKSQTFNLDAVYTNNIVPHPQEIRQADKQLVKYTGFLHYFSQYKTITQKLLIKLSSSNIISHTQVKPFTVSSNKIKYGAYENIEPLSNQTLVLHYENNNPFLTVNYLERVIEVSHWGNIAVKENIYLTHTGAKLKGSFSRYEFQKDTRSGLSSVKSYKTILPSSAVGVYYRDTNGNISTSNMNILRDSVELELRPRFPLFGGWKTFYTLGYNVPSFEYLFNLNENFLLKMRLIDHVFDDMVIEKAEIKIILPEGSNSIDLKTPYSVERSGNTLFYTYLDTVGRPVVTFTKTNLIEDHIVDFELKYKFAKISLLQEPVLVTAFIFIIFILTIIFIRLDFSINTHQHKE